MCVCACICKAQVQKACAHTHTCTHAHAMSPRPRPKQMNARTWFGWHVEQNTGNQPPTIKSSQQHRKSPGQELVLNQANAQYRGAHQIESVACGVFALFFCLRLSASVCVCLSALSVVCVRGCGAELCCLSSVFLMTHREFLQLHQQILHTCANDTTVRSNVRAHASTQSQSTTEGASVHPIPHSLTPSLTCLLPAFGWLILSTSTLH